MDIEITKNYGKSNVGEGGSEPGAKTVLGIIMVVVF